MMSRRTALLGATGLALSSQAQAQGAWYPVKGMDGRDVVNFRIPVEIEGQIETLPQVFLAGSSTPDVTLTEVYDLNCPWCRRAAADLRAMVKEDEDLKIRYVNAPALGIASFQAAKVEYAVRRIGGNEKALAFHHAFMSQRGTLDGLKGLEVAKDLGFDPKQVEAEADSEDAIITMKRAVKLAGDLNLSATPSWLISGIAIVGYPGSASLRKVVASVRKCDRPVCG